MMETRPIVSKPAENDETLSDQLRLADFVQAPQYVIDMNEQLSVRLPKQLANSAMRELELRTQEAADGRGYEDLFHEAAERARDRRLELADSRMKRLQVLTQFRDFQKVYKKLELYRLRNAAVAGHVFSELRYREISAELGLALGLATLDELRSVSPAFQLPDGPRPSREQDSETEDLPAFAQIRRFEIDNAQPTLRKMLKERVNSAVEVVHGRYREFCVGRGTLDVTFEWAQRALTARLELLSDPAQLLQVLVEYRDFLKAIEDMNQKRFNFGAIKRQDLEQSRYERLTAEIELVKTRLISESSCLR